MELDNRIDKPLNRWRDISKLSTTIEVKSMAPITAYFIPFFVVEQITKINFFQDSNKIGAKYHLPLKVPTISNFKSSLAATWIFRFFFRKPMYFNEFKMMVKNEIWGNDLFWSYRLVIGEVHNYRCFTHAVMRVGITLYFTALITNY